tara:strand:+ start:488 stop:985 length:498 start_codon:yes stop_codon:yes gene_type:complete
MKSVIIFRHGKSDWGAPYGDDHDRPLSPRGINASKLMGTFLLNKKQIPDLIISSTALRAKHTAELAYNQGNWDCEFTLDKNIYGGSPNYLLDLIQAQNDLYSSICLVGHEPNFSSFIALACGSSYVRFTTANMAKINFDVDSWSQIKFGIGSLQWHQRPKDLNNT